MVCTYCNGDTQVTNSRPQKRSNQVWRRRKCADCAAIFSTIEAVDVSQAFRIRRKTNILPFSRDTLLLSIYDSLRHRSTAVSDASALTSTILSQLLGFADNAIIERDVIVEVVNTVLGRFDIVAATHYHAFHKS